MGRSYWFECARCGYRAKVSGRPDRGLDFFVQTILCRDCKELYDAVTRMRFPDQAMGGYDLWRSGLHNKLRPPRHPPKFQALLTQLPLKGIRRFRWLQFPLQCPASPSHRVQSWNDPDSCPRCGILLERNALPYRIWE